MDRGPTRRLCLSCDLRKIGLCALPLNQGLGNPDLKSEKLEVAKHRAARLNRSKGRATLYMKPIPAALFFDTGCEYPFGHSSRPSTLRAFR